VKGHKAHQKKTALKKYYTSVEIAHRSQFL